MKSRRLYQHRFSKEESVKRSVLWEVLYQSFLYRFIRPADTVLDIGAGGMEFLHVCVVKNKIAVDPLYPLSAVKHGIHQYSSLQPVKKRWMGTIDVVMLSNILEHMEKREDILRLLSDIRSLLKPQGKLLIIQPTIDLVGNRYWDFFDHIIPITRQSLTEVVGTAGFTIKYFIPRFLPYTTKTRLPLSPWLLRWYLALPSVFRPCAGQCFLVGENTL